MLCLRRKPKESIVLTIDGVQVAVIVESVRGESVKLGIVAPPCVGVVRAELLDKGEAA